MSGSLKVFMGGDVFSDAGIAVVEKKLKDLRQKYSIDFVIYNGENASGGNGLLEYDAKKLFEAGVDVITGGNHIFDKRDIFQYIDGLYYDSSFEIILSVNNSLFKLIPFKSFSFILSENVFFNLY